MKLISALSTLGVAAGATPIVATACSSAAGESEEVVAGYSISCSTAANDGKLVTQPGQ